MVIIITFAALFALFFLIKHHSGASHLAMIAGLSVYDMFGADLTTFFHNLLPAFSTDLISTIIYLALILAFPLLLYFRSGHGGLPGPLRLIDATIFSLLLTSLLADPLAKFFQFDTLSVQLSSLIASFKGSILLIGIVAAYFDILFHHEPKKRSHHAAHEQHPPNPLKKAE